MVKRRDIFRRCSGLMNHNFRVKSTAQILYHSLYIPANFQDGCAIPGVARKVKSLRFCRILYVKKRSSSGIGHHVVIYVNHRVGAGEKLHRWQQGDSFGSPKSLFALLGTS
jgi:hypothetical protein